MAGGRGGSSSQRSGEGIEFKNYEISNVSLQTSSSGGEYREQHGARESHMLELGYSTPYQHAGLLQFL